MSTITASHKSKPTPQYLSQLQSECGVRAVSCPFEGVAVDPHLQAVPDPDHFLDLGITRLLINHISNQLTKTQRNIVNTRIKYFPFPKGWKKINITFSDSKKHQPMSFVKKAAIICLFVFRGLVQDSLLNLLRDLIIIRSHIYADSHTCESVQLVLILCLLCLLCLLCVLCSLCSLCLLCCFI